MAIISVGSYAEAERKGIKPVDSIISVAGEATYFVKKKNPPYKVVGYGQGYTFKEGEVTFAKGIKPFVADIPDRDEWYNISAVNKEIAKKIAKDVGAKGLYKKKLKKVV